MLQSKHSEYAQYQHHNTAGMAVSAVHDSQHLGLCTSCRYCHARSVLGLILSILPVLGSILGFATLEYSLYFTSVLGEPVLLILWVLAVFRLLAPTRVPLTVVLLILAVYRIRILRFYTARCSSSAVLQGSTLRCTAGTSARVLS